MGLNHFEVSELRREREAFEKIGYTFEIDANGYSVKHKSEFVGAAGVLLPREKPLHWKHADANRQDNLKSAVATARRHATSKEVLK